MCAAIGMPYHSMRTAYSLRSWPFGPFANGHAACRGKRRALRRMSAACEAFYESRELRNSLSNDQGD